MQKFVAALILVATIAVLGCTNKEGDSDLDIITPNDTTQSRVNKQNAPID